MKLTEIAVNYPEVDNNGLFTSVAYIHRWLRDNSIHLSDYEIYKDLTVGFDKPNIMIHFTYGHYTRIPFNIKHCECDLKISMPEFSDLSGLPDTFGGMLDLSTAVKLKSLDGISSRIGDNLYLPENITSLIGISKHIKEIGFAPSFSSSKFDEPQLGACFSKITHGGLGLLEIKDLVKIEDPEDDLPEPFKIISKYLGDPSNLFECQSELIDAGYEEFAHL